MVHLATFGKNAFRVILATRWVADGLTADETSVVDSLAYLSQDHPQLAQLAASFAWIADDIDTPEASVVRNLQLIAQESASDATRIAVMPFLTTLEPADVAAMESLGSLAYFRSSSFRRIMRHSTLNAGVSDDWANIVATLHGVDKTNPQLIDSLLDHSQVRLNKRTIRLPLAGQVDLAIIRLRPEGATRSMDLLEYAVRSAEALMGAPFPSRHVGLLFATAVSGSNAGTNFGTHVALLPEYDVNDGSHEASRAASIIAHEVAHYYWSGNVAWIDEGASELIAAFSENVRIARPMEPDNDPCGHVENIAALENLGASGDDRSHVAFGCNYSLGERIFLDLYHSLGENGFQQAFRALYQASKLEDGDETTKGTSLGIAELRQAFAGSASAQTIVARWYGGTEPYDTSGLDRSPADSTLLTVSGSMDSVNTALSSDDCYADSYDSSFPASGIADWVYVCLNYSYSVPGGTGPVDVPLEYVVYYEDGFAFERRRVEITAESRYSGGWWTLPIGPQPPDPWAPGRYYIYVYNEDRKVGEGEFTVLD